MQLLCRSPPLTYPISIRDRIDPRHHADPQPQFHLRARALAQLAATTKSSFVVQLRHNLLLHFTPFIPYLSSAPQC